MQALVEKLVLERLLNSWVLTYIRAPRKIAGPLHWENWLVHTKPSPELTFSRWDGSPLGGFAQFFEVPISPFLRVILICFSISILFCLGHTALRY